jgi:hypothetical protein
MNTQNPQEAFFSWLGQALLRAVDAVRGPQAETAPNSQLTY